MTTMLERAARALADAESDRMQGTFYPSGQKLFERMPGRYYELARAVLMAVREPGDDMKESAGWSEYDAGCWAEGIDAILGENK